MPNVFVATPTYQHSVMGHYAISLSRDILLATKTPWMIAPPYCSDGTLISRSRNFLFNEFMEQAAFDYLMFIDADLGWEPHGIQKVLETPGDIVGGCYRKKQAEIAYSFWPEAVRGPYCEVDNVPGGFMCIKREAAQKIYAAYRNPFNHMPDGDEEKAEDVAFCIRARKLGLSVVARLDIEFQHYGVTSWDGSAMEDLRIPARSE